MARRRSDGERVARITYPTSSYSLEQRQIEWLRAEAKRHDMTASKFLREVLRRLMADTTTESEQAA